MVKKTIYIITFYKKLIPLLPPFHSVKISVFKEEIKENDSYRNSTTHERIDSKVFLNIRCELPP